MPMIVWTPPAGGPHGTSIEVRVASDIYNVTDGVPTFVPVERVAAITTALTTAVPSSTVTTPAGAQ
jgi:hypothetical protein